MPSIDAAHRVENRWPVLRERTDRERSIIANMPAIFPIEDNAHASSDLPTLYASVEAGTNSVRQFDRILQEEAKSVGVDPDLIRAIMFVETSQGHYFGLGPLHDRAVELLRDRLGARGTILPMNIDPDIWGTLGNGEGKTEQTLFDPRTNIRAGTVLLKRIRDRLQAPTVRNIATLYNSLGKEAVSDYGARVERVYRTRAWARSRPLGRAYP